VLLPGETEAPGSATGKLGVPDAQTVGVPFDVRVRACDDDWYTVTSVTNVVRLACTDATADLPGPAELQAGAVTLAVTVNASGSFTISASDESDPSIPDATSAPFTTFALQGFEFGRINQKNQYAGEPMSITLAAVDPRGDVVDGYDGPVSLQEMTSFGVGRISPDEVMLSGGRWSGNVTMYRADETNINRGNVNIVAYLGSDPSINGTSDPFVVHPGPFSRVQIVVPGQAPAPGSVTGLTGSPATQSAGEPFAVDVYSTDPYWNPLPSSDVVRITSSDPDASTPVSGALVDGHRRFTLSLGTVGTQTLTVNDQSNGSISGMTTAGIPVIPSAPHHFVFEPIDSPVTAGEAVTVTIRATDASGNTVPGYFGDAVLTANTGPGTISPELIAFADGVWSGDVICRGAGGAVALTCADYGAPPHTGTSENFVVDPGVYAGLQVLLPGQNPRGGTSSGFTGVPADQQAGTGFPITVRAVDEFWNRVPGITSRIALDSSDEFADMPAETTLVNGQLLVPVTLFRSGMQTISVSDADFADIESHTSSEVLVIGGPYARILLLAPGEEPAPGTATGRTGAALDQSINFGFNVTVYATDTWWNPVGGVADLVRITSTDPAAILPPDAPLVDGRAELNVRLSTGGYQQITATNLSNPSMPASTTQVRAISSGFHLEAEVSPGRVRAGEPFVLTVRVTNDAGAVITEIHSFVDVTVRHASSGEPGRGTLLTTRFQLINGQRAVTETYTFAEPITLVATDDAGNDPAITAPIIIDPGPPDGIELTSDPSWVRGNRHATVRARVVDAYANGVPGQPVDFMLVYGPGLLTPMDSETGPDGVAAADFLSPRSPGRSGVEARSNDLSALLQIETALVDPGMPGGSVTNYPNPFHPGESPTTIAYKLADDANVALRIYTLSGDLVLEKRFSSGATGGRSGLNEFIWDGRNGDGRLVATGAYILDITAKGGGETMHVMRRKLAAVR
jgi:hypothetical protein